MNAGQKKQIENYKERQKNAIIQKWMEPGEAVLRAEKILMPRVLLADAFLW